jgi:hypothetical protein
VTGTDVLALAVSGTSLVMGGDFTQVNGVTRIALAEVDLASGALQPFDAGLGPAGRGVNGFALSSSGLFVGGDFDTVMGASQPMLTKLDANGVRLPFNTGIAPYTLGQLGPKYMAVDQGKLYTGGSYNLANGCIDCSLQSYDLSTLAPGQDLPLYDSNNCVAADQGLVALDGGGVFGPTAWDAFPTFCLWTSDGPAAPDAYEDDYAGIPNNGPFLALNDLAGENRTFDLRDLHDDFARIHAVAGMTYTVETFGLAPNVDTALKIFYFNGVTLSYYGYSDDKSPTDFSSQVTFVAPFTGDYNVSITRRSYGGGTNAAYKIRLISGTGVAPTPTASGGAVKLTSFPNPYHPGQGRLLSLRFAPASHASLELWDLSGHKAFIWPDAAVNAAAGLASWNGTLPDNSYAAPGLYFLLLRTERGQEMSKMTVIH